MATFSLFGSIGEKWQSKPFGSLTTLPEGILRVRPFEAPQSAPDAKDCSAKAQLYALSTKLSAINLMDARMEDPSSRIHGFKKVLCIEEPKLQIGVKDLM